MTYGYIRVSCDKQTVENQRFEIGRFCERQGLKVNGWFASRTSRSHTHGASHLYIRL